MAFSIVDAPENQHNSRSENGLILDALATLQPGKAVAVDVNGDLNKRRNCLCSMARARGFKLHTRSAENKLYIWKA